VLGVRVISCLTTTTAVVVFLGGKPPNPQGRLRRVLGTKQSYLMLFASFSRKRRIPLLQLISLSSGRLFRNLGVNSTPLPNHNNYRGSDILLFLEKEAKSIREVELVQYLLWKLFNLRPCVHEKQSQEIMGH
jgi:hypothetical protein